MATLPENHPFRRELEVALPLVRTVAAEVNRIYEAQSAGTYVKGDGSPLTDADLTADRMLREGLSHAFPNDGLMTEETEDDPVRLDRPRCWIADPIDGTAQFVARTGDFDVMLALVVDSESVLSLCAHPPSGTILVAIRGHGAWIVADDGSARRFRIDAPASPPVLVGSQYYGPEENATTLAVLTEALDAEEMEILTVGCGPRSFVPGWRHFDAFIGFWRASGLTPVGDWDLAPVDPLVTEAGGTFTDLYGNRYRYNLAEQQPRLGLLATASPELHERILGILGPILPATPPVEIAR